MSCAPRVVATRGLAAGEVLDTANTAVRQLPAALVAEGACWPSCLPGAVVATPIPAGEPVLAIRVGRAGDGPVAALLVDGARGIAIPTEEGGLPLRSATTSTWSPRWLPAAAAGRGSLPAAAPWSRWASGRWWSGCPAAGAPAVAQALADGGVVLALGTSAVSTPSS